jgi:nitrite reductase/ring-hydroxylating ferredoxin subunit
VTGQAPESATITQISADEILVQAGGMRVRAQSECPHRKGRLRFGVVNARRMSITCPLHQSTFDLRTGRRLSGPDCGPLRVEVLTERADT